MVGQLLLRGMLVGAVAGLLAFGFAKVLGEPQVDRAIAFEESQGHHDADHAAHHHDQAGHDQAGHDQAAHDQAAHDHADHADHAANAGGEPGEIELVSRATQAGFGLFTAVVVYGAAMGGLFALVFAVVNGRLGKVSARATAALLALAAFVAIVLVPAIKYPPNPPAVGSPDTIGTRTAYFFVMLALSIATLAAAVGLARRLQARFGGWNAALLAGGAFIVVIVLAQLALPEINEVPRAFSAVLLWRFRLASLGMQLVLWATIGLLFGALTERAATHR
ncbi:MAG TPA: CbtA family protein [Xanthobacteraceae bacterium]|nr:CbtA family protein [Xanthobacteraceae bacterium]